MKDWIKKIIVLILFHCEWKFSYSTIRWIYKEFLDYSVTNKTGKNKFVSDIGFFKTFFFFWNNNIQIYVLVLIIQDIKLEIIKWIWEILK